jgi:hypothetical protein
MFRDAGHRLLALFALAAIGCSAPVRDVSQIAETRAAVASDVGFGNVAWEQFDPAPDGDDLATLESKLPLLAQHGLSLSLHWPADQLQDPARWQLVQHALALGVPVYPWITLAVGETSDNDPSSPNYAATGYFPNATNAVSWCATARTLMEAWQKEHGLPPTTLLVDFEMRRELLLQFTMLSGNADLNGTVALLKENRDRIGAAGFARALKTYTDFLRDAHRAGFRVEVTTLLPLLDDFDDGDDSLRQGFQVPLDLTTPWDRVSFQVQRTIYQSYGPTSYFVYYYAEKALKLFGARVGVGLGVTDAGWATGTSTYASGADLRQDTEAALAAGIPEAALGVYSFYGMYKPGQDEAQWFQAPEPHPAGWAPPADLGTLVVNAAQDALDAALKL